MTPQEIHAITDTLTLTGRDTLTNRAKTLAQALEDETGVFVHYMIIRKHLTGESGIGVGFTLAYRFFEQEQEKRS